MTPESVFQDRCFLENLSSPLVSVGDARCVKEFMGMCLVQPSGQSIAIFGFGVFVTALSLLVVIFTTGDNKYKFRIAITSLPMMKIAKITLIFLGLFTLLTEVWFQERWLLPYYLSDQILFQGFSGFLFFALVLFWLQVAYKPQIFNKKNAQKYTKKVSDIILTGNDAELTVLAQEMFHSTKEIIKFTYQTSERSPQEASHPSKLNVHECAYNILLHIASPQFCWQIIQHAPQTAIMLFQDIGEQKKYDLPIGVFARNITEAALRNKNSLIFHESSFYQSGLQGHLKLFSKSIYGNYDLIEKLSDQHATPFSLDYRFARSLDTEQYAAYLNVARVFCVSYFNKMGEYCLTSYVFREILKNVKCSCDEVYKLNELPSCYQSPIYKKLQESVGFITDLLNELDKRTVLPQSDKLKRQERDSPDFYDQIAGVMFKIITDAASVKSLRDESWDIQYCVVWSKFFDRFGSRKARKIVLHKLRRLLYDEITGKDFNLLSAKLLGICLNTMGFRLDTNKNKNGCYALHKVLLKWTMKNFVRLSNEKPEMAQASMICKISYDKENHRLVKVYFGGTHEHLELDN